MSHNPKTAHVAGPITVTLVDGTSYVLTPLTMADLKELETYVQAQVIAEAKKLAEGLPAELAREVIIDALAERKTLRIGAGAFDQALMSNIDYVFFVTARKKQPALTWQQAKDLMTIENLSLVGEAFAKMQGGGDDRPLPVTATA